MNKGLALAIVCLYTYTNPKKLLYKSPHPDLLPLEKETMRTYWDWYYFLAIATIVGAFRARVGNRYPERHR
jgi:hypothetical protein